MIIIPIFVPPPDDDPTPLPASRGPKPVWMSCFNVVLWLLVTAAFLFTAWYAVIAPIIGE